MASILVSEADPDVRQLLIVLMERRGSSAIALDRNVEIPPRGDLLLLEPATGWCVEQARLARLFFPELPIICMGLRPEGADFLRDGTVVYLEKPFTVEALEAAVAVALREAVIG